MAGAVVMRASRIARTARCSSSARAAKCVYAAARRRRLQMTEVFASRQRRSVIASLGPSPHESRAPGNQALKARLNLCYVRLISDSVSGFPRLQSIGSCKTCAHPETQMATRIMAKRFGVMGVLVLCAATTQAEPVALTSSNANHDATRSSIVGPRLTPPPRPLPPITVINTNDSGPGSLRQALADAHDSDHINFAQALNGQTITLTSAELVIDKDVTISGPGQDALAVSRSPNTPLRIFHVTPGHIVTISGLTITGGGLDDVGGGILNDHATLTVSDCAVRLNGAIGGGGIYNDGSNGSATLTVLNSTISRNVASSVGGIANDIGDEGSAMLILVNSSVNDNMAAYGSVGGIANSGVAAISNSTISGNSAPGLGGGIFNIGTLTITNTTINGNYAGGGPTNSPGRGGGVCNLGTLTTDNSFTIVNSTVSGNTAAGNDLKGHGLGGAIYTGPFESGSGAVTTLMLKNSTLSDNRANDGGGIYNYQWADTTSVVEISNTILSAGASGENIFNDGGTITSRGYNLSSDDGGGYLTSPGDQINTDPLLGPLQDNGGLTFTHALLPGSPAIDAGDPNFTPPPYYDQRGPRFRRVFNGRIDIGSFETQPQPSPFPAPRPRPTLAPR